MSSFGNNLREGVIKFQLDNTVVQTITVKVDGADVAHWEAISGNGKVLCSGDIDLGGKRGQLQNITLTTKNKKPVLDFAFMHSHVYCDLTSLYNLIDTKQNNLTAGRFISLTKDSVISNTMSKVSELENDVGYYNEIHWTDVLERPEINKEISNIGNKVPLNNIELDDVYYFVDLSGVIPYKGATRDADLNNKSLKNIKDISINGTISSTVPDAAINHIVSTNKEQEINAKKIFKVAPIGDYYPSTSADLTTKDYVDFNDLLRVNRTDFGKVVTYKIYDQSATYKANEVVFFNTYLYKSLVDIDTPEPFNPSKWSFISIQDLLDEKQEVLKDGVNIKTIAGESILGPGNFVLTKDIVGLDKVDNTSDLDKPISNATQRALDEARDNLNAHLIDKENPHEVTKAQVGLGNVTNDPQVKRAEMGVASGVATLDDTGKIPLSQFPEAILGQLVYGGTFNASGLANLSSNAKSKLGIAEATLQLVNSAEGEGGWVNNQGIYYIASAKSNFANLDFNPNDILLATATAWFKIDNTDFVTSVAGKQGNVTLSVQDIEQLEDRLGTLQTNIDEVQSNVDSELSELETTLSGKISSVDSALKEEIKNVNTTLSQKIENTESTLSSEIASVKADLTSTISTTKQDILSTISITKNDLTTRINSVESTLSQRITTNANNISSLSERLDGLASGEGGLRIASDTVVGGIKTGYSSNNANKAVKVDESGNAYVNVGLYFDDLGSI